MFGLRVRASGSVRRAGLRLEVLGDRAVPSVSFGETQTGTFTADYSVGRVGEEIPSATGSGGQIDVFGGGNVGGGVEYAPLGGEVDLFGGGGISGGVEF